jgi:hypothetical protein
MIPLSFLAAIVILGIIFLSLPQTILSVKEGIAGRELATFPIGSGSWLEVEYVHSMYGVRQSETFLIDRDLVFRLEKVLFGSLTAALYYDPDPPSGLILQNNLWITKGDGKRYPILKYRVGTSTGHTLKLEDRTIDLSGLFPGTDGLILIEMGNRSRWATLFVALKEMRLIP